jgi:uncharacterized protein (TIGR02145 family)
MKKLLFSLFFLLTITAAWAQAPQRISYQSIIRDANNVVVASSPVGIKISLLRGTATGPAVYVETHGIITNANGLVSLNIGEGRAISGRFAEIDWSNGPYLIQTATDPTGGTDYSIVGTAPLNSVPYALNAATATKLRSPVTINGIAFDGSSNVTIPATGAVPYTGATRAVDLGTYDLKVNGVTVGRGKGNIPTNTANGVNALANNTLGAYNTAIGTSALYSNTGSNNTASGSEALLYNTTGYFNMASGYRALYYNTTGYFNTASGSATLFSNTTGGFNSAFGIGALYNNTAGSNNTASGNYALSKNNTGSNNTAIGNQADVGSGALINAAAIGAGAKVNESNTIQLGNSSVTKVITSGTLTAGTVTYPNIHGGANQVLTTTGTGTLTWATPSGGVPYTGAIQAVDLGAYDLKVNGLTIGRGNGNGESNTATGNEALASNTTGSFNMASGAGALKANTTGSYNTASGEGALSANTTGSLNMASGNIALLNNTTGDFNTASGNATLIYNTSGSYNTASGIGALSQNTTGSNNTAFGNGADVVSGALTNATAIGASAIANESNTIQLGNTSVTKVITSGSLTAGAVTYPNIHGGANQVLTTTGTGTLTWATPSGGVPYTGATQAVDLGAYNLKVNGLNIGRGGGNVDGNTANGSMSLYSNSSGNSNTAYGYASLYSNTTGSNNIANGNQSLYFNTTGSNNTAIGNASLNSNTEGVDNTANGFGALYKNTGSNNTASGSRSLYSNTTGGSNTALGYFTGITNTTGTQNTLIGYSADVSSTNLSNATALGNQAIVTASNTIQLGNADVTNVITSGSVTANGVKIGRGAGNVSTNTAVGNGALETNATGGFNTSVGSDALKMNTGSYNIAVGSNALKNNAGGDSNTAMGFGSNASHTSGSNNASFGTSALASNTGSGNTAIGAIADVYAGISNATAVGFQALATANNTIQLGNTSVTNVKTSGTLTAGVVTYPKTHGTSGQVLTTTGSGALSWGNGLPTSVNTGDMLFWNGSAWVKVAAGTDGQTLTFIGGKPVWTGSLPANTVVNPNTGKIWMDRNLGATQVATNITDAAAYGYLYQWGRGTDGHQIPTSGTTTTLSGSDVSGDLNFILTTNPYNNWRSSQNDNLWQGVNGVNNPCPTGYRIPTATEWFLEYLSWSSQNSSVAFASPLKLPTAGYRSFSVGSPLIDVGTGGYYWSSTVNSTGSMHLYFSISDARTSADFRADGLSVRCIKD